MSRGANVINLDTKGYFATLSRYRNKLISKSAGQLIVIVDSINHCLRTHPLDGWGLTKIKLRVSSSLCGENCRLQRLSDSNSLDLELHGTCGRFIVPLQFCEYAKLYKYGMLVGQLNKFQLWGEDAYAAISAAELAAIQQPGAVPKELCDLIL